MSLQDALARAGRRIDARRTLPRDLRRVVEWPAEQGWGFDGPPSLMPAGRWTTLKACRVVDGGLRRWADTQVGFGGVGAPGEDGGFVIMTTTEGIAYWFVHGGDGWHRTDGTTTVAITGPPPVASYDLNHTLTGVVFNDFPIINDPADGPWYWPLTGTAALKAPDWAADWRCYALRSFREHLVAISMQETAVDLPDRVRWSDQAPSAAMPAEWVPSSTNLAGFVDLTGERGSLLDGEVLGPDQFALYKEDSTYTLDYVGPPYVFRARHISSESGIVDRNCVARVPMGNVVATRDDVVLNDGQRVQSLMVGRIRDWWRRSLDYSELTRLFVKAHPVRKEVWVVAPLGGHTREPLWGGGWEIAAWNWERDEWSLREFNMGVQSFDVGPLPDVDSVASWDADPDPWSVDQSPWNNPQLNRTSEAMCYISGRPSVIDPPSPASGGAWMALDLRNDGVGDFYSGEKEFPRLQRESWDCGNPRVEKSVLAFKPRMNWRRQPSQPPDLEVRFGTQLQASDPIAWGPFHSVSWVNGEYHLDIPSTHSVRGVFISIELSIPTLWPVTFEGFQLLVRDGGRYIQPRGALP